MENQILQNTMEENEGFNQGDFVVVAGEHNHYLAVFNNRGILASAANFDGTKNYTETKQIKKELCKTLW